MARTEWQKSIEELRRDNRSGSMEIEARALDLLVDAIGDSVPRGAASYRQWLLRISREVVSAQPSMAVLFRLVDDMLWACHDAGPAEQTRLGALGFLQEHQARKQAALDAVIAAAAEHLASYRTIMTYSRSSTVSSALVAMAGSGCRVRVFCSEGRPMFEGQTLASELAWAGAEVTLGIDMALFGWLPEVNALVLGADSVSVSGVVNKIGTAELVRAAAELEIPRIVLCTTSKFLPNDYFLDRSMRSGDPEEIMPVSGENLTVRNVYFDITPLGLISTVISEGGALDHARLTEELSQIRIYPGLRGRQAQ